MIKGLFKLIFGLIRLAFLLIILGVVFHTWVIKQAVIFSLSYQLGADVSVQSVKMDWKNTGFEVQGLEIGNPYSFPKGTLANIPILIVSMDLPSISRGVLHFKTVGFDLRELQVMNVPQKGLNLLDLKPLRKSDEARSESSPQETARRQVGKYAPKVIIDELIFSVGDIGYLDMSGPSLKQNRYKAGIRGATYYDVRGAEDVTVIVVAEALKKMSFGYLGVQLQKLQGRYVPSGSKQDGFLSRAIEMLTGKPSN
jgi:hypothetical protein